jgi:hypothetical protein
MGGKSMAKVLIKPLGFGECHDLNCSVSLQYKNAFVLTSPKDGNSVSTAAKTLSLAFATDPLLMWLYRDANVLRWDSLTPSLQKWQELRVRQMLLDEIAVEAVTDESIPRSLGVCFIRPPPRLLPRWTATSRHWWEYIKVLWNRIWERPKEPACDEKVKMQDPFQLWENMD